MKRFVLTFVAVMACLISPVVVDSQQRDSASATLTALDYYEIEQLYARYCHGLDSGADTGYMYADVFTPDGIFIDQAGKVRAGREQLAELGRGAPGARRGPTVMSHFVSNVAIEPAAGGATGKACLFIAQAPNPAMGLRATLVNGGQYWDELVKTPQGWRYKEKFYMGTDIVPDLAKRFITPASSGRSADVFSASGAVSNTPPPAAAAGSTFAPEEYAELQQLYARSSVALDSSVDNGAAYARWFTSDGVLTDAAGRVFAGRISWRGWPEGILARGRRQPQRRLFSTT